MVSMITAIIAAFPPGDIGLVTIATAALADRATTNLCTMLPFSIVLSPLLRELVAAKLEKTGLFFPCDDAAAKGVGAAAKFAATRTTSYPIPAKRLKASIYHLVTMYRLSAYTRTYVLVKL